jgi:hypothetical protein
MVARKESLSERTPSNFATATPIEKAIMGGKWRAAFPHSPSEAYTENKMTFPV